MAGTCVNGWPGIEDENDPRLAWITVPGTSKRVLLRKEAAPLFAAILSEVNKTVIALDRGPLDGWEYRQTRTGQGLSCHAGAVATDMRYDVLLADNERHMSQRQIDQMHRLLDKYVTSSGKRVFGWGGDWTVGRFCDEMHLELIQSWSPGAQGENCTLADVQDCIKRLGIRPDGTQSLIGKVVGKLPAPKPKLTAHQAHLAHLLLESKKRKLTAGELHELHMAHAARKIPSVPAGKGPVWAKSFLQSQGLTGNALRIGWTICGRESSWDPSVIYPPGKQDPKSKQPPSDWGLWQTNTSSMEELKAEFGPTADMRLLLDPVNATRMAKVISSGWTDWRAWGIGSVKPNGTVVFDWSWYPKEWLDKMIGSRTQREVSEADFLSTWKRWA